MRFLLVCIGAALLAGCHHRQPKMSAAQMAELRADEPGLKEECLDKIRWGGVEALTGSPEDCYKFDSPRRWKGLWLGAFETSRFCPEPARNCSSETPGDRIWLQTGPGVTLPKHDGEPGPTVFDIDFIGHKTSYPGGYGHEGESNQEIIIDRIISMKRISAR